jgi:hypothetical protein
MSLVKNWGDHEASVRRKKLVRMRIAAKAVKLLFKELLREFCPLAVLQ